MLLMLQLQSVAKTLAASVVRQEFLSLCSWFPLSKRFRGWSVMGWADKKEGSISSLKGLCGQVRGNQSDKRRRGQAAQSCVASAKPLSTPPTKGLAHLRGLPACPSLFPTDQSQENHPPEPLAEPAKFPAQ